MNQVYCKNEDGEQFTLFQNTDGLYCCPVCGSPEFDEMPYNEDGLPSYNMCSCGFEFGYDDSPLASSEAIEGIKANWDRWRLKVIKNSVNTKEEFEKLERNLNNLGIKLAFDLIPVKDIKNT